MIRFRCGISVLAMLGASCPALAADLSVAPIYKAPPTAVQTPGWSGFYVGVNAGGAWGDADISVAPGGSWLTSAAPADIAGANLLRTFGPTSHSPTGFTGGATAGYNVQNGSFVAGVEADFNYIGLKTSTVRGPFANPVSGTLNTFSETTETNWLATVRGRAGFLVNPNTLVYGTGGVAFAQQKLADTVTLSSGLAFNGAVSDTKVGWTVGGGLEYSLGSNWTAKFDYLYADLGKVGVTATESGPGADPTFNIKFGSHYTVNVVRAGVNYKFDVPVISKY
ncbi:MAG: outer rane immunogenic protein [Alphaproteobacteria bacterium]|nr:outer rane immunogenic protein [Alphaproteobacteria bacterium]